MRTRALWLRRWGHHPARPVVVLIAGAYSNALSWHPLFIQRLADANLSVVALDMRDTGRNAWGEEPFSVDDMADDVLHTLVAHRISRAHVFGASMGGAVALRAARRDALGRGGRVASLSVFATTPERCLAPSTLSVPRACAMRELRREWELHRRGRVRDALARRHPGDPHGVIGAMLRHGYNPEAGHGVAFLGAEPLQDWGAIVQPTLIVHGTEDPLFPSDHAWRLHHLLPRSKLHLLPVGHAMPTDEQLLGQMADLITAHARSAAVGGLAGA